MDNDDISSKTFKTNLLNNTYLNENKLSDVCNKEFNEYIKTEIQLQITNAKLSDEQIYIYILDIIKIYPIYVPEYIIVHSELFTYMSRLMMKNPLPVGFQCFQELLSGSTYLIKHAVKQDLISLFTCSFLCADQNVVHHAFKLFRRLLCKSHFFRICFFHFGLFELFHTNISTFSEANVEYLSKTVLRFVLMEPVFGIGGYKQNGREVLSRTEILRYFKEIDLSKNNIMLLSNFLKYGSIPKFNKHLWLLLNVFIAFPNIKVIYSSLISFIELAELFCENKGILTNIINYSSVLDSNFIDLLLNSNSNRLIFAFFELMNFIVYNSDIKLFSKILDILSEKNIFQFLFSIISKPDFHNMFGVTIVDFFVKIIGQIEKAYMQSDKSYSMVKKSVDKLPSCNFLGLFLSILDNGDFNFRREVFKVILLLIRFFDQKEFNNFITQTGQKFTNYLIEFIELDLSLHKDILVSIVYLLEDHFIQVSQLFLESDILTIIGNIESDDEEITYLVEYISSFFDEEEGTH